MDRKLVDRVTETFFDKSRWPAANGDLSHNRAPQPRSQQSLRSLDDPGRNIDVALTHMRARCAPSANSFWLRIAVQHCHHGVVSSGDIRLIGQFVNGSDVRALDHIGLIAQNAATLRFRGLLDDLRHRFELPNHHCGHPVSGLANLLECALYKSVEVSLVGDDTDESAAVAANRLRVPGLSRCGTDSRRASRCMSSP